MKVLIRCGAFAADLRDVLAVTHGIPRPLTLKVAPNDPPAAYGTYIMELPDAVGVFVLLEHAPNVIRVAEDANAPR